MPYRVIETERDIADFARLLGNLKLPVTVEWRQGKDRSLDQNKLQFLWANEAAQQLGDRTPAEVQAEWKLIYGVPILREDSEAFRELYDTALKPLPYHLKLKAMPMVKVTSEMTVRQMVRYLDTVQRECLQNGIRLTDPDPELRAYQARYRAKTERKVA